MKEVNAIFGNAVHHKKTHDSQHQIPTHTTTQELYSLVKIQRQYAGRDENN